MRAPTKVAPTGDGWEPIPDPDGRYSSGIPDFDRLLGGGFQRGSLALFSLDETVGTEDLDLLLFRRSSITSTSPVEWWPYCHRATRLMIFGRD